MSLTDRIPQVVESNLIGHEHKVIQVTVNGKPYLRSGRMNNPDLLARLISDFRSVEHLDILGEHVRGTPPNSGKNYTLVGAGRVDGDVEKKIARFYGDSVAYDIGIDTEHIKKIRRFLPGWTLATE